MRNELDADTSTDWPVPADAVSLTLHATLPQLIRADAPIQAFTSTVATATEPESVTAAVPATPAAMPIQPR